MFWKEAPSGQDLDPSARCIQGSTTRFVLLLPMVTLAALTVFIGLAAEPLLALVSRAAEQLMNPAEYIDSVLGGSP